jgi:hypothetical protein
VVPEGRLCKCGFEASLLRDFDLVSITLSP